MYEQQNNTVPWQTSDFWIDFQEKRRIQKIAWAIAVPGYVFFFVSILLSVILALLITGLGFDLQKARALISDPAANQVLEIIFSLILMTVPFIISAKITGYNISASAGFNKPEKGTVLPYFLFGIGFCAFSNIAVSIAGDVFERFGIDYSVPKSENPPGVFGFLLVLIATAIVPPLVEEFAFRGIVLGLLRPFGDVFAIFASAAAFGILHGNFEQMPFAFLVGLALGFIRIKSGSVIVCMAVHSANNLIAVLVSYINGLSAETENLIYTVYILLALVSAVVGVTLLKHKGEFSFPERKRKISAGKTYRYFFFSPAMIVYYCLFFFRALLFAI